MPLEYRVAQLHADRSASAPSCRRDEQCRKHLENLIRGTRPFRSRRYTRLRLQYRNKYWCPMAPCRIAGLVRREGNCGRQFQGCAQSASAGTTSDRWHPTCNPLATSIRALMEWRRQYQCSRER